MNIKQKLTWVFAAIACLPVIMVAVLVVLNLRSAAQANFLDSSGREIRQIDNGMKQFFESIRQNVEYLAKDPRIASVKGLKNYTAANAEQTPVTEADQLDLALHDRVLAEGLAAADKAGIIGKDVTPFLLDWFHTQTNNQSLEVNVTLINANARLAAEIAVAALKS